MEKSDGTADAMALLFHVQPLSQEYVVGVRCVL